ncbi:hypothetical protein IAT40_007374 [Kwoniella sp. CBS 6097]
MKFARSKGGCVPCRKQKKKCDQRHPTCQRCVEKKRQSHYLVDVEDTGQPEAAEETAVDLSDIVDWSQVSLPKPLPITQSVLDVTSPVSTWRSGQGGSSIDNTQPASNQTPSSSELFLQSLFGADSLQPILPARLTATSTDVGPHLDPSQPHCALLSLPLDTSSALWTSFALANGEDWMTREINDGEDGPLVEYFINVASTTVVVRDVATSSAGRFFADLAQIASASVQSALMHAVLCVSAQHLANWSQKAGDVTKALTFGDRACRHKLEAISMLRRSNKDTDSLNPAVMVMLTLAALLKGESDIIPSFLTRATYFLGKVQQPSSHSFLPSIAAIHAVHIGLHSLSVAEQTNLDNLFRLWDDSPTWSKQADEVCASIFNVHKNLFLQLLRVNQLALKAKKLFRKAESSPGDMAMNMAQLELEAEARSYVLSCRTRSCLRQGTDAALKVGGIPSRQGR